MKPIMTAEEDRMARRVVANYFGLLGTPVIFIIWFFLHGWIGEFSIVIGWAIAMYCIIVDLYTFWSTHQLYPGGLFYPLIFVLAPFASTLIQHRDQVTFVMVAILLVVFLAMHRAPLAFYCDVLLQDRIHPRNGPGSVSTTPRYGWSVVLIACLTFALGRLVLSNLVCLSLVMLVCVAAIAKAASEIGPSLASGLAVILKSLYELFAFYVGYNAVAPIAQPKPTQSRLTRQLQFYALIVPLYLTYGLALIFGYVAPESFGWERSAASMLVMILISFPISFLVPLSLLAAFYAPAIAETHRQVAVPAPAAFKLEEWLKKNRTATSGTP